MYACRTGPTAAMRILGYTITDCRELSGPSNGNLDNKIVADESQPPSVSHGEEVCLDGPVGQGHPAPVEPEQCTTSCAHRTGFLPRAVSQPSPTQGVYLSVWYLHLCQGTERTNRWEWGSGLTILV